MIYTEPLFLGVTPTGARNYVADKVVSLEKPFFNACAGRFSVVEAAIKAGSPAPRTSSPRTSAFSRPSSGIWPTRRRNWMTWASASSTPRLNQKASLTN